MKKTVLAAGIVSLLMPVGVALAADTHQAPQPPRPSTLPRPMPPIGHATGTPPRDLHEREGSTTPPRFGTTTPDRDRPATSTATTTPHRYRPTELRGFLRWLWTLPASTTVGELKQRIDSSALNDNARASAALAVPSDNIFASMLEFLGFPMADQQ